MSGASERANGRASGPVLMSGFLVDLDHSAMVAVAVRVIKMATPGVTKMAAEALVIVLEMVAIDERVIVEDCFAGRTTFPLETSLSKAAHLESS